MTYINDLLIEIQNLNQKIREYINSKIPPDYDERLSRLRNFRFYYNAINQLSYHLILAVLFVGLGIIFTINGKINSIILAILLFTMIFLIIKILKIDWSRNNQIRELYVELGDLLLNEDNFDRNLEENDLLMEYVDKIEDIKNVRNIIYQINNDTRIEKHLRSKWFEIWAPSLISFLNEFYGYPESVIMSRLEFQQKLFERVLLSGLIGFAFIIVRSFPISPNILILSDILSIVGMFVFLVIFLLIISYPLIRYPALKLELAHWINEHEISLHLKSNHPAGLLGEKELNESDIPSLLSN